MELQGIHIVALGLRFLLRHTRRLLIEPLPLLPGEHSPLQSRLVFVGMKNDNGTNVGATN